MDKKRIALFGGTFDPIHLGHTGVSKSSFEKTGADKLLFIPARQVALKANSPVVSDHHRQKMIELAIADFNGFEVSDYELTKPAPAYTLDTVLCFKEKFGPQAELYWLIGADCVEDLPRWYKIEQLIDQCRLCTMYRTGYNKPNFDKFADLWGIERVRKLQENIIETPLIDISSSELRQRLAAGRDVSDMLDGKVLNYIKENHLYGC
ncbi:MAG: nicotinate (nicotinamide) nucleotide adenylyltransferase [Sedimentisphaerales bacterium]|nr:nicotinate (nicotinamide) nucleotide adenylyltransferase [Sedimentisphaerales bacterium]